MKEEIRSWASVSSDDIWPLNVKFNVVANFSAAIPDQLSYDVTFMMLVSKDALVPLCNKLFNSLNKEPLKHDMIRIEINHKQVDYTDAGAIKQVLEESVAVERS